MKSIGIVVVLRELRVKMEGSCKAKAVKRHAPGKSPLSISYILKSIFETKAKGPYVLRLHAAPIKVFRKYSAIIIVVTIHISPSM